MSVFSFYKDYDLADCESTFQSAWAERGEEWDPSLHEPLICNDQTYAPMGWRCTRTLGHSGCHATHYRHNELHAIWRAITTSDLEQAQLVISEAMRL